MCVCVCVWVMFMCVCVWHCPFPTHHTTFRPYGEDPIFRCSVITFKRSAPWYDAQPPRTGAVDLSLSSPHKSSFVANCTHHGPSYASSPSFVPSPCATTAPVAQKTSALRLLAIPISSSINLFTDEYPDNNTTVDSWRFNTALAVP
jgi:hypothetical protein